MAGSKAGSDQAGSGARAGAGARVGAGGPRTPPARQAPAATLGWEQVRAWRVRRHRLDQRAPRSAMLDVVAEIAGLHAQVLSSAELTLLARVDDLEPDAVRRALWEERSLVKTWAMRATLHLLPAAEFPIWQAALRSQEDRYWAPVWLRNFGVTREQLQALLDAVAAALHGRVLTREELADEVDRLTGGAGLGDKVRGSWGAFLKPAAWRGDLCFGPSQGQRVCFTRPDHWLHDWPDEPPDQEEALRAVTRRFLAASGPVTTEDFGRWWGLRSAPRTLRLISALGDEVVPVTVDGTDAWMLAEHADAAAAASIDHSLRLLPAFDQYVVTATKQAARLMPGPFADRIYRPQGWLSAVLLVNGRMDGVWRAEARAGALRVAIEPFTTIPAWARRAAEHEAERLAAFAGKRLDLTWSAP
jgi:Winged helix DNA-binding domain